MFRTINARLATLAALTALTLPAAPARAQDNATAIYRQTLKGTVYITVDSGSGSGWVADLGQRLIVTNHHVVVGAKQVTVYFPKFQGDELVTNRGAYVTSSDEGVRATVLLSDPKKDLAVIQVERIPEGVTALKLAAKSPSPGERVHALGNPGVSGSLWVYSAGYVRAVYRQRYTERARPFDGWVVETSLPTNPGDSGGPEVNDQAELIAVTSHHRADGRLVTDGIDVREVKEVLKAVAGGERGSRGKKPAPADEEDEAPVAPRGKRALLEKANRLMAAKQFDEALEVLTQLLQQDPENVEALTQRAWIYNEQGQFDKAIRDCTRALEIDADSAAAYRERGFARVRKKQPEAAVKDLTKAVRLNPKDAITYVYRAQAYMALGEDERADADLAKAKQLGYRSGTGSEE
jgi:Flp pilus assembly protein TadD